MKILERLKDRVRLWLRIASPSNGLRLLGEERHARWVADLTGEPVRRSELTPLERLDLETTMKAAAEMPYIAPTALFHLHDDDDNEQTDDAV